MPPIRDAAVVKECGACHMAYAPQMLPMRSWQAIMGNLGNHFGETATLSAPERQTIEAYLVAHAGDAPGTTQGHRFMRGIPADATPLRITDTRFWNSRPWRDLRRGFRKPEGEVEGQLRGLPPQRRGGPVWRGGIGATPRAAGATS